MNKSANESCVSIRMPVAHFRIHLQLGTKQRSVLRIQNTPLSRFRPDYLPHQQRWCRVAYGDYICVTPGTTDFRTGEMVINARSIELHLMALSNDTLSILST